MLCFCKEDAAAAAKSLQSCLTQCDPRDGSPPGSPVPGILQARTLEWVAISFSNAWKWKVKSESEGAQSCLTPATPWTVAYQAPPSMEFSRQEYWSGVPYFPKGFLANVSWCKGYKKGEEILKGQRCCSELMREALGWIWDETLIALPVFCAVVVPYQALKDPARLEREC